MKPPVDSKGAAIDEIFEKAFPLHQLHPANDKNFEEAKQAIFAILAQEVKKAQIDERKLIGSELKMLKSNNDIRIQSIEVGNV